MLPISASERMRHTPAIALSGDAKGKPAVYVLETPSVRTRADMQREFTVQKLYMHADASLMEMLAKGIDAVVETAQLPEIHAIVEAYEGLDEECRMAVKLGEADEVSTDIAGEFQQVEQQIHDNYAPFRIMCAQRSEYLHVAPFIICARFIAGWENLDVPFRRVDGLVPEELLTQLPDGHLLDVGAKIITMLNLSLGQRKNSPSPSRSRKGRRSSSANSRPARATNGSSSENSTPETQP